MAAIPITPVTPLWEHPSTEIQCLSTWKQQLNVMYDLTDTQRAIDKKLKDAAESAESSSAAIHGDSEDVHAICNNSHCNRENSSIMVKINCQIDQGTCNHL
uniref:Uncharacterized protein n=1 Tax=Romanomermis culicivorax TaxID=13658 RepID=A0A915L5C0_ROMCU